ncbi:hypothetical protein EWH99_09105 [Sporolactobacillus sp. THM7-7]|nr:hypothetical protein EWH99_09105 [Sporolactobacillus sp. THM7-7]
MLFSEPMGLLTRQALNEGHKVTATTRHPDPRKNERLQVMSDNAFVRSSVEWAVIRQMCFFLLWATRQP